MTTPGWRDPRLWTGIALVAACVVVGARVVDAADDSIGVWVAAQDLGAGDTLDADALVSRRVRFEDDAAARGYLRTDDPLPPELSLLRPVGAGELLPRSALGDAAAAGVVEVPVGVAPGRVPGSVGQGSVVDVWVAGAGQESASPARLVLDDVVVLDAPPVSEGFGSTGERTLVLAVEDHQADRLPRALAAAAAGAVFVTREG